MSRPVPGLIALAAVQLALRDAAVPVVEVPPGSNSGPRVDHMLRAAGVEPGNPWCQAAVYTWLWESAGSPADFVLPMGFPRSAYTPDGARWARKNGLWISPEKGAVAIGDLVYFWHESLGRIAHVGIVKGFQPEGPRYVSGNTNTDGSREGVEVAVNLARWDGMNPKSGFVRLPF